MIPRESTSLGLPQSAARQTGFLYLEKLLEFRASHFQSEMWDEQFSSFVATL